MGFVIVIFKLLVISSIAAVSTAQPPPEFICRSNSPCRSVIEYAPPNATTIAAVQRLFEIKHLLSFLGANNLPENTPLNSTLPASGKVKIPFHCKCNNGTGLSDKHPKYKVQSGDSLDKIAEITFSRLITLQQIAKVNDIMDPSKIDVGQELWIPLPCSCDEVDGKRVVHYGHLVETGSSISAIAGMFNVSEQTILKLNGISDPKTLQALQVLDIPLQACSSVIREDSLDYPFLISNDTYDYTANNCVFCKCDATKNWNLECKPSELKSSHLKSSKWSTCPSMQCEGGSLIIGNSTSSGCDSTTCAYAGYSDRMIFTNVTALSSSTCRGPSDSPDSGSKMVTQNPIWTYAFGVMHLLGLGLLLI